MLSDTPQISTELYVIDTYAALTAASAIAANSLLRYIFGATFPLFTVQRKSPCKCPYFQSNSDIFLPHTVSAATEYEHQLKHAVYKKLGIGWASSLLGFLSLAMLPNPWALYKLGPQIRARSKFETNDIPE